MTAAARRLRTGYHTRTSSDLGSSPAVHRWRVLKSWRTIRKASWIFYSAQGSGCCGTIMTAAARR
ncbi:hypothetical protein CK247_29760, partial [Klebsiella pneumoniae]